MSPIRRLLRREQLPDEIVVELIDLMYGSLPSVIVLTLCNALLGVGLITRTGDFWVTFFAVLSASVSVGRVTLGLAYRRTQCGRCLTLAEARRWEAYYAGTAWTFSICVGGLSASVFAIDDPVAHMVVCLLTSAYVASMIIRVAVRPVIAVAQYTLASTPLVVASFVHDDTFYRLFALFFLVYLVHGLQLVRELHRTILERVLARRELAQMVRRDPLTGLSNRAHLDEEIEVSLARIRRHGGLMAVHWLDLDRFKAVNDSHGHPAGDTLLMAVAARLRASVRETDLVARVGGDEFVIVQRDIAQPQDALILARRIQAAITKPFLIEALEIQIGVSAGIAVAPHDAVSGPTLLKRADLALYRVKAMGRGNYELYDEAILTEAVERAA